MLGEGGTPFHIFRNHRHTGSLPDAVKLPLKQYATVPTGSVTMFGAATAPTGWLNCDGSAIPRTTYVALFAVIGTTWGVGDGSTTFNVPNSPGRTPIGVGGGHAFASSGGAETVTLTEAQMPIHNHTQSKSSLAANPGAFAALNMKEEAGVTGNKGGGLAHPNMQPFLTFNFIIKI